MQNPKFTIFSGADKQYYFRLRAGNGEIILGSEGYVTNAGCRAGIASVKVNAPFDARYERFDKLLNYRFNLKAGNSESYESLAGRENGIAAVKSDAPGAPIEDIS